MMVTSKKSKLFNLGTYLLIAISVSHLIGHFFKRDPESVTEKLLFDLMTNYKKPVAGGEMSMMDIQSGLSLCYGLFFLGLAAINLYMMRLNQASSLLRDLSRIESVIFAVGVMISVQYFFWLPVVSFTTVALCFGIAGFQRNK
jgi:hypothetical protein